MFEKQNEDKLTLEKLKRQKEKLQNLCRTLETERKKYKDQLTNTMTKNENDITLTDIDDDTQENKENTSVLSTPQQQQTTVTEGSGKDVELSTPN